MELESEESTTRDVVDVLPELVSCCREEAKETAMIMFTAMFCCSAQRAYDRQPRYGLSF